jgi:hypothetical protein
MSTVTKTFTWIDPALNTDGSALNPGEVTGYNIGIRPASGTAGTYPTVILIPNAGATTTTQTLNLPAGNYLAAAQAVGPTDSAWSVEVPFTVAGVPNPPTGLTVT